MVDDLGSWLAFVDIVVAWALERKVEVPSLVVHFGIVVSV